MEIVKKGYSSRPWRLVNNKGQEVSTLRRIEHAHLGWTTASGPICGNTKAECFADAMSLLDMLWEVAQNRAHFCGDCGQITTVAMITPMAMIAPTTGATP